MTKSKTIAAALATLILATAIAATSGEVEARFGAAAVSSADANSAYMVDHGYDECRFVDRIDRKGSVLTMKICDVVPY